MDQRPIGVFDSGLGGLTAVHSLWRILPEEDLIYFGDTARVPYGSRSREAILKYARQDVRFLRSFDLKAILIACGTVTTTSLAALQAENDLPMVGVVEPTCRRAVLMTQNKRVGLIATAASVRSGAYEAALRRLDPEVTVFSRACPLFVPLAEAGRIRRGDVVIETVAREYLTPLKNAGVDTLILGCTHYPLLTDVIGDVMGPGVELVSAGEESAFELKRMLKARELRADERRRGETEFYVVTGWGILSGRPRCFCRRTCAIQHGGLTLNDIETRWKKLPVLLFIRGEQYFDDVDPDATELTTEGTLELTEKDLLLTYQETALTGMEGTTTTFEVSGPQVILRRVGSVNSQMVFEEGRQHTSLYETPYGELSVDIQTSALRHNLSERGGLLEIKYSIAVEHTVTGRNSFKIRVKRK